MWLKNAEYAKHVQKYKGRDVLREDNAKDEEGYKAVFTEQGASASPVAAATFLDTLSKLLGMAGQTSDAMSVYTQVKMTEASRLLRIVLSTVCHLQVTCEIQKSTSAGLLCVSGSHTFVPISRMCKKQTAVSHGSARVWNYVAWQVHVWMDHQLFSLGSVSWKHCAVSQPWEKLSVTSAKESFRLIHTLTVVYLSQLTMLRPPFPTAHTQPNSTC